MLVKTQEDAAVKTFAGRRIVFFFLFLVSYAGGKLWWPQQRKKEECERLSGERDQIAFIHLRFERWQVEN